MTWFKVDDNLAFHAKVVMVGNAAMGLWVRAGSWSAQQLTDGFLPEQIVLTLGTKGQAKALVAACLWEAVDGGYQIHDYLSYNPTADEVRADQARKHESKVNAGRAGGVASGIARRKHTRSRDEAEAKQDPKQNRSETKPRPDPSRPDQENSSGGGSHVSSGPVEQPPLLRGRCTDHQYNVVAPKCGACKDARIYAEAQEAARPRLSLVSADEVFGRPAWCGHCDEFTRQVFDEDADIVSQCKTCHPLAVKEAS